jgi:putative DNA primase/helicase
MTMNSNIFTTAFDLHSSGYSVIPSGGGDKGKAPVVDWVKYQNAVASSGDLELWQTQLDPKLWGVVTGKISGIVVLDADTPEVRSELESELGTPHVSTPRGGGHWYFKHPGHPVKTIAGVLPSIDVRADGGFINIVGASKYGTYEILTMPGPDSLLSWERLPERIRKSLNGSKPAGQEAESIPEGKRNEYLTSLAGSLRRRGIPQGAIETALLEVNTMQCQPPLPEKEVLAIAKSISRYPPDAEQDRLTDTGNAENLASLYGNEVRFDWRRRRWLLWRNHRWETDRDGHIARLAVEAARGRYAQAENIPDLKERQRVATWAIVSESRMRIEACISLTRSRRPIADSGENWDSDIWLLGMRNGVVDLKTGELHPGQPDDRITMTAGFDFDPQAKCPRWEQFLTEVFENDELIDWLWRALGYSISGDTTEQVIFLGHGIGANGKGVFSGAIHGALGDYAYSAPFSTFELYQRAGIPNDLAALEFRRFITSSETNDNTRLNEARVKAISGCDPITARYLHQEYFTFWPHLKLWLFVNHRPKVVDDSFGFWRRVRLIPFNRQFTGEADDRQLAAKLRAEAPGILAWLVRGCLEWQRRGLEPVPECVRAATQEYRVESDILAGFISDKCIENPKAVIKASELYAAYKEWAEGEGMRDREVLTSTAFGRRMRERYQKERKGGTVNYHGISLPGQLQDSFEANDTENNVFPICNDPHVKNEKTILNYPVEAKSSPNYPADSEVKGEVGADVLPIAGFKSLLIQKGEGLPDCYKDDTGNCALRIAKKSSFTCAYEPVRPDGSRCYFWRPK